MTCLFNKISVILCRDNVCVKILHSVHLKTKKFNAYVYIHNWPLQPSIQDYGLVSHTTHLLCIHFIHEWRDLQFNVDSKRQIFEKFSWQVYSTLRVFARNMLRGNSRRNIFSFHISFCCLTWDKSNKPTYYLLDYSKTFHRKQKR